MTTDQQSDHPGPVRVHTCSRIGANGGEHIVLKDSPDWEISSPLYIMGMDVGTIIGKGPTREAAEADLHRQLCEASEGLWAE